MLIIYIHHHHHNVQTFFFCSEKSIKKTLKFLKNPDLNDSNKYLLSTGCCSRINDGDANDIFLFTLKKISIHFFFVFAKQPPIICHTHTHKQTFWIEIASNFCLNFFSHKKKLFHHHHHHHHHLKSVISTTTKKSVLIRFKYFLYIVFHSCFFSFLHY